MQPQSPAWHPGTVWPSPGCHGPLSPSPGGGRPGQGKLQLLHPEEPDLVPGGPEPVNALTLLATYGPIKPAGEAGGGSHLARLYRPEEAQQP